jgi:peptide deformylase
MVKSMRELVQTFEVVLEKVPEIVYAGDPILRQPAAEASLEEGIAIAKRLEDVLMRFRALTGIGRGIAAPQIGESKKVFISYVDDTLQVFINPVVVERAEKTNFYRELCMSVGIVAVDVERPEWIVMEWTDVEGARQSQKFDGFLARMYQHEEAHLRGILNLDEAAEGGIEYATFDPLQEKLRDTQ